MRALAPRLERRLNRQHEPPVVVTIADDFVCFHSQTWQPILLARVEDALDELVGSAWRGFMWT